LLKFRLRTEMRGAGDRRIQIDKHAARQKKGLRGFWYPLASKGMTGLTQIGLFSELLSGEWFATDGDIRPWRGRAVNEKGEADIRASRTKEGKTFMWKKTQK